ncbi:hypothetical protein H6F43_08975, partial [Leptolyngbya sp. FACHB-36]
SSQAIAPEILRYGQVRKIARQVQIRLHEAWMSEAIADRPVTYVVAADETGAIADYQPVDARAADAAEQTPLPHLVKDYRSEDTLLRPLARFHVTFKPSGSLNVQLWRGIPLLWLAISTLIAIVAAGAIVGYVETRLL